MLKELADDIAPILLLIKCRSIASGEVPANWRKANVASVFKKGQKYIAEDYGPISMKSVCCMIKEHILARNVMSHGKHKNIINSLQHGFRQGIFCETQLIEFIDGLKSNLEEGQQTDTLIRTLPRPSIKSIIVSSPTSSTTAASEERLIQG